MVIEKEESEYLFNGVDVEGLYCGCGRTNEKKSLKDNSEMTPNLIIKGVTVCGILPRYVTNSK